MGLITSYSAANMVVDTDLCVSYSVKPETRRSFMGNIVYEVHRYATKQYRYVGMTAAAAQTCAADKISQYTRTTRLWEWDAELELFKSLSGSELMAEVSPRRIDGEMWEVVISVREDDTYFSLTAVTNPVSCFNFNRSYD